MMGAANVERFPSFALSTDDGVGWNVSSAARNPSAVEVAQDLVLLNGVLVAAPSYVSVTVARCELARDYSTLEVAFDNVQRFAVRIVSSNESARWHAAAARANPLVTTAVVAAERLRLGCSITRLLETGGAVLRLGCTGIAT